MDFDSTITSPKKNPEDWITAEQGIWLVLGGIKALGATLEALKLSEEQQLHLVAQIEGHKGMIKMFLSTNDNKKHPLSPAVLKMVKEVLGADVE